MYIKAKARKIGKKMLKKYAVIGNPIVQSKSPEIHLQFAEQFNHQISYQKILAEENSFNSAINSFIGLGGLGMNVTAPFKLNAAQISDSLSERAKSAQAVNTLIFKNSKIYGDNTDGLGLVRDIEINQNFLFANKKVLIIGAGGACRGILLPILETRPAKLLVINRTAKRAQELAAQFAGVFSIAAGGFDASQGQSFDIVINATSAGLDGSSLPPQNFIYSANSLAYDLVYSKKPTLFMQQAKQTGASKISDGLGMLVEQAAYAYKLWHGVMPKTLPVLAKLRQSI